jgi:hypothetical protein
MRYQPYLFGTGLGRIQTVFKSSDAFFVDVDAFLFMVTLTPSLFLKSGFSVHIHDSYPYTFTIVLWISTVV